MLIPFTIAAVWLSIGYLFWCAVQYGAYKFWYITYKEDYSQSPASVGWAEAKPVICVVGPINLVVAPFSGILTGISFKYGITLYFKMPKDARPLSIKQKTVA